MFIPLYYTYIMQYENLFIVWNNRLANKNLWEKNVIQNYSGTVKRFFMKKSNHLRMQRYFDKN